MELKLQPGARSPDPSTGALCQCLSPTRASFKEPLSSKSPETAWAAESPPRRAPAGTPGDTCSPPRRGHRGPGPVGGPPGGAAGVSPGSGGLEGQGVGTPRSLGWKGVHLTEPLGAGPVETVPPEPRISSSPTGSRLPGPVTTGVARHRGCAVLAGDPPCPLGPANSCKLTQPASNVPFPQGCWLLWAELFLALDPHCALYGVRQRLGSPLCSAAWEPVSPARLQPPGGQASALGLPCI